MESGVALVITLILLSVITFMAVTFLVISRHEGAAVDTLTQQANAKFATDAATEYAKAQIMAKMLASTNGLNFDLMVSTNLGTNIYGGTTNITDVSYYDSSGNLLTGNNMLKMLNNQIVLPRPPVFVFANKNQTGPPDFRFWNDLNRNGLFDANGAVAEVDGSGNLVTNIYVGDPEWIGILNHPEQRHSSSNFFVARYCFIALPIGNSLDINYIHNQSKLLSDVWANGYLRNQGVGTWELNLAAFLHELNPNWDNPNPPYLRTAYGYAPLVPGTLTQSTPGSSFDDATAILQYRYVSDYHNLRPFRTLYGAAPAGNLFGNDYIDGYGRGPLMTNLTPLTIDPDANFLKAPWSGDYSTNQFFSTQDLFNVPYYHNSAANAGTSFSNHLYTIGRTTFSPSNSIVNSINRYTFYNLLKQMSFGSAPEPPTYPFAASVNSNYFSAYGLNTPKMNLNYVNVGGISETNYVQWSPAQFFTNAADRMLRAYFPNAIGVTNDAKGIPHPVFLSVNYIPVYPTNYYTPAVHRVLQLAANMYDSLNTNRYYDQLTPNGPYFPSVFRPIFFKQVSNGKFTNIFVAGYQEVSNNIDLTLPKDFRRPLDVSKFQANSFQLVNVYGVPYVIGARTGFPCFNKFSSMPVVKMARKLSINKNNAIRDTTKWTTNVQYSIGVTNVLAVECWYPSTNSAYSRPVTIYASDECDLFLTNDVGASIQPTLPALRQEIITPPNNPSYQPNTWPGSPAMFSGLPSDVRTLSFRQPLTSNVLVCPESPLIMTTPAQIILPGMPLPGQLLQPLTTLGSNTYRVPNFVLNVTNRVRLMMVDLDQQGHGTGRLIDCVMLGGYGGTTSIDTSNNVSADLIGLDTNFPVNSANPVNYQFWSNPRGFANQVLASESSNIPPREVWTGVPLPPYTSMRDASDGFVKFLTQSNGTMQVPIVATHTYYTLNTWAANDPLVHYMASDLSDLVHTNLTHDYPVAGGFPLTNDLGRVYTARYQPWGNENASFTNIKANVIAYKDPLYTYPEATQFPTNKFPNIGWLGRVHRGTPWQTVYLKSPIATNDWMAWTGNPNPFDALASQPKNDWLLMDLFTTTPNENADKGQLSVNQTNYAAWAAALGGLITVQNQITKTSTNIVPLVIDPTSSLNFGATQTNTIEYLVNCINATRTNFPGGVFSSLGQICAVPQLTVQSPFLNLTNTPSVPNAGISDAAYERIPQQLMSLLRLGTPRYVIFAYGQSLKPADRSIVNSGPFFGMCTNYQITGEVATRTVVRIDNYPVPGQPLNQFQPRAVVESFTVLGPDN